MNLAEGVQVVSLAVLGLMMLASALGVVLLSNIVHSAFLLGMTFVSISGIYILLNAGFVAAAQILIYVGAVNVLILFAIMLVNKRQDFQPLPAVVLRKALTAIVCLGLFVLLSSIAVTTPWALSSATPAGDSAIVIIGEHFFSDFLLPFELASVLLLMALIGAVVLARRDVVPDQAISDQAAVESVQPNLTLPERRREAIPSLGDR
jgi:NAD(P)H-quinone oxidoreductase subunit 6